MLPSRPIAAAAALLALAACVHGPPAGLARDPAPLAEEVRAAQARVLRVRGTARVHVEAPQLSGTVTEFVAAEKPDRVRLETLDFFGSPAAILVAAGGRFAFLDVRAGVLYRGDATPENVSRLLPVVVPVDELATILCGSSPLLAGEPVDVRAEDAHLVLTVVAGALGQRVAVEEQGTVAWSRVRRPGADGPERPSYDLAFDRFQDRNGVRFPLRVELDAPASRARLELTWRPDLEVNPEADPDLFKLEAPRGVRVIELEQGAPVPAAPELPLQPG